MEQLFAASTLTRRAAPRADGVQPHGHDCCRLDLEGGRLTAARLVAHRWTPHAKNGGGDRDRTGPDKSREQQQECAHPRNGRRRIAVYSRVALTLWPRATVWYAESKVG